MQLLCVYVELVSSDCDLPRSRRSGRLLLPPLAFWANHRLIVSPKVGGCAQLIQGSDNLIDDGTHVCFTDASLVSIFHSCL